MDLNLLLRGLFTDFFFTCCSCSARQDGHLGKGRPANHHGAERGAGAPHAQELRGQVQAAAGQGQVGG